MNTLPTPTKHCANEACLQPFEKRANETWKTFRTRAFCPSCAHRQTGEHLQQCRLAVQETDPDLARNSREGKPLTPEKIVYLHQQLALYYAQEERHHG